VNYSFKYLASFLWWRIWRILSLTLDPPIANHNHPIYSQWRKINSFSSLRSRIITIGRLASGLITWQYNLSSKRCKTMILCVYNRTPAKSLCQDTPLKWTPAKPSEHQKLNASMDGSHWYQIGTSNIWLWMAYVIIFFSFECCIFDIPTNKTKHAPVILLVDKDVTNICLRILSELYISFQDR